MQTPHKTALTRISAVALLGAGALAGTACRAETPVAAAPQAQIAAAPSALPGTAATAWPGTGAGLAPTTGGAPVAVNCGPGQQALIRPAVVAGQAVSQVDCVPLAGAGVAPVAYQAAGAVAMPAAYYTEAPTVEAPVVYRRPARQVVYREAPAPRVVRRSGRSWQKSAVIIGSSAGVGAGIGAAIDGKKGALIGAALAGGGATIWDQATRRK